MVPPLTNAYVKAEYDLSSQEIQGTPILIRAFIGKIQLALVSISQLKYSNKIRQSSKSATGRPDKRYVSGTVIKLPKPFIANVLQVYS